LPSRTQIFSVLPWTGGLSLSRNASNIDPQQLVQADHIQQDASDSKRKREGINSNWDDGWYETTTVILPAASSITTGQYFTINSPTVAYYVWYNKASGGGDPAPGGKTAITVAIGSGDTAAQVATATAAAIAATGSALVFSASADTATVTIANLAAGGATDAANVNVGGSPTATVTKQGTSATASVIGLHDYWYGTSSRAQRLIAVYDNKEIRAYTSSGVKTANAFAGTAWSSAITNCKMVTFNNLVIITADGSGNVVKKVTGPATVADLGGTPPQASICHVHGRRLWLNDKTNLDRLQYSPVDDAETWGGSGDSGAIDISPNDGDPEGITAMWTFKGDLIVAKKTRLYRVQGLTPETYSVSLISSGIGCVSANSVVYVDQDDVFFVSEKGVHSMAATQAYGDLTSAFVSTDIQKYFNDNFTKTRLKFTWGAYSSQDNAICFSFTDENKGTGSSNSLWWYELKNKAWFTWPSVPCQSICAVQDSDRRRIYLGGTTGRISKAFAGVNYDTTTAGAQSAVSYIVKTGRVFPAGNPNVLVRFNRFFLIYEKQGVHTITATVKVDGYAAQSFSFSGDSAGDLLGTTFTLGSSVLGGSLPMNSYGYSMDGIGRGVQVTLQQSGFDQAVDVQGWAIEFEPIGGSQETAA